MKLTAKQRRFIDEYVVDLNATQAGIRAGYSPKTARVTCQETLSKPAVKKAIAERLELRAQEAAERGEYNLERIKQRLAVFAEKTPDKVLARDVLNALVYLAKLQGFWKERAEVETFDHAAYLAAVAERRQERDASSARDQLDGLVTPALAAMARAVSHPNPRVALPAARDVLERAGRREEKGRTLEEILGETHSLRTEEEIRIGSLPLAEVLRECQERHGGACADYRYHAERCADERWAAGDRQYADRGDKWRVTRENWGGIPGAAPTAPARREVHSVLV